MQYFKVSMVKPVSMALVPNIRRRLAGTTSLTTSVTSPSLISYIGNVTDAMSANRFW